MKAFSFRLDQALRWRATQVDIEKARVAAAAALVDQIRLGIEALRREMASTADNLTKGADGDTLHRWALWSNRCQRELVLLAQRLKAAETDLAACMTRLVQANQNARLLEKLKAGELAKWKADSDRELEAFAGETFLRQVTIKKRTGA